MSSLILQADAGRLPLADGAVDLVMCSPPYEAARTYGVGFKLRGEVWVEWAVAAFMEHLRVCRGLVVWVVDGQTRQYRYSAAPVLMMADLHRRGVCLRKPAVFARVGIPGSGGPDWLRNDWEFCVCATATRGRLPWSDNTACGHSPKFPPGGAMSNRHIDGRRKNARDKSTAPRFLHTKADGSTVVREARQVMTRPRDGTHQQSQIGYTVPAIANPGNIIKVKVGGGRMGHDLAHENEAPYPLMLAEFFVRSFCPPEVCSTCGTAVQYRHENKTMQAVPIIISERQPPSPVLLEGMPTQGVQNRGDGSNLRSVREDISDMGLSPGSEQVLLQGVCNQGHVQATGDVQGVRGADTPTQRHEPESVLLKEVRKSVDFAPPKHDEAASGDTKGIRPNSDAAPSPSQQGGLCDGAPGGNGEKPRKAPRKKRSGASQEWEQERQQHQQLRADAKARPRPATKAAQSACVSEVRPRHRPLQVCAACGADLTAPGAIRPGIVFDPFSGSGTTAHAAMKWGRRFIASDLRLSQCELTRRRLSSGIQLELSA